MSESPLFGLKQKDGEKKRRISPASTTILATIILLDLEVCILFPRSPMMSAAEVFPLDLLLPAPVSSLSKAYSEPSTFSRLQAAEIPICFKVFVK